MCNIFFSILINSPLFVKKNNSNNSKINNEDSIDNFLIIFSFEL